MIHSKFGHFLQDLFIILIAFLVWPKQKIHVKFQSRKLILKLIKLLDWSNTFIWETKNVNNNNWLEVKYHDQIKTNRTGVKTILTYSSGFYAMLLFIDIIETYILTLIEISFYRIIIHLIYCIFIWYLIFNFLPVNIVKRKVIFLKKPFELV